MNVSLHPVDKLLYTHTCTHKGTSCSPHMPLPPRCTSFCDLGEDSHCHKHKLITAKMGTHNNLIQVVNNKLSEMLYPDQYQEWKGDVPHKQYDLPLQQGVMEYNLGTGVGTCTIVQSYGGYNVHM